MNYSVRSTNVYEENSIGVYHDEEESINVNEDGTNATGNRATVWSRYLAMHARKQLSFGENSSTPRAWLEADVGLGNIDMWWLALALFLVCIIEVSMIPCPVSYFPSRFVCFTARWTR